MSRSTVTDGGLQPADAVPLLQQLLRNGASDGHTHVTTSDLQFILDALVLQEERSEPCDMSSKLAADSSEVAAPGGSVPGATKTSAEHDIALVRAEQRLAVLSAQAVDVHTALSSQDLLAHLSISRATQHILAEFIADTTPDITGSTSDFMNAAPCPPELPLAAASGSGSGIGGAATGAAAPAPPAPSQPADTPAPDAPAVPGPDVSTPPAASAPAAEPLNPWAPTGALAAVLDTITTWGFDLFTVSTLLPQQTLCAVAFAALRHSGVLEKLGVKPEPVQRFLAAVEQSMMNSPYHNAHHVADVVQSTYHFIAKSNLTQVLSDEQVFAMIMAAAVHDLGHPGVNNPFLCDIGHPLAITYNDNSVLENMHVAAAFRIAAWPGHDFCTGLALEQRTAVRKHMIAMVLATDNAMHFSNLGQLQSLLNKTVAADSSAHEAVHAAASTTTSSSAAPGTGPSGSGSGSSSSTSSSSTEAALAAIRNCPELVQAIMCGILHAADISNPAKPWRLYMRWVRALISEYFLLGDMQRRRGLPVTPMLDRTAPLEMKVFQLGFIRAIVLPLFSTLDGIPGLSLAEAMAQLTENTAVWDKL